jgi:hypothetical protein
MKVPIFCLIIHTVIGIFSANAQITPKPQSHATSNVPVGQPGLKARTKNPLKGTPSTSLRGAGMSFTQNKGQIVDMAGNLRPDVLYKGDGGGSDVYIRKTGISYVLNNMGEVMHEVDEQVEEKIKSGEITEQDEQKLKQELLQKQTIKLNRVDVDFANSNSNSQIQSGDQVDGFTNYYYAHCPQGITHVHSYNIVTQKNIYPNIDVKYYGSASLTTGSGKDASTGLSTRHGLKYDIVVNPGADPNQIKLKYTGAKSVQLKNGRLQIETGLGQIEEHIPKVYQNINGKIVDVKAEYILEQGSDNTTTIHFSFSTFNSLFPLVVDPWATYYGGSAMEMGGGIATDATGNVYLSGTTTSLAGIASVTGFQTVYGGSGGTFVYAGDAFLVKFNSTGTVRLWATYYGGTGDDRGRGVATDAATGDVYMAGFTNSPTGIASGTGFQTVYGGGNSDYGDAFLVKFNGVSGNRLWATYYGGSNIDMGLDVTVSGNNVYLYGFTASTNAIATAGAFQTINKGGTNGYDYFVVQFNTNGNRLWASYVGGSGDDYSSWDVVGTLRSEIVCDSKGDIYISGTTLSSDFPVSFSCHQPVYGGAGIFDGDAFLFKFNPAGNQVWATYYGGSDNDAAYSVSVDGLDNVILCGYSSSKTAIASASADQIVNNGGGALNADAFIAKFNSVGIRKWGTYFGGLLLWDFFLDIAIDANNNIYAYGEVEDKATNNLVDLCAYQPVFGGGLEDQLIVKYNPNGQKQCVTYMGGTGEDDVDTGGGITIYGKSLYIAGITTGGYPITAGAFQTKFGGGNQDAFLASICTNICEGKTLGLGITASTTITTCQPVKFTPSVVNSCDTTGYKFHWVFTGGNPAISDSVNPTVSFPAVGTYDVKLVVTTICKKDSVTKPAYITVTPCTATCTLIGQYIKGTANCAGCGCKEWIMVTASDGTTPYTYAWPGGYDKRYQNKLCPGNYTIMVTDKNGCSVNVSVNAP